MKTRVFLIGALFLAASLIRAGEAFPDVKVIPWNGHKAATSLTFDDGDPSHLDVAIPELDRRHMHGTFFLIANHIDRKDDWRKILASGHEIGNHTLDHKHAKDLTPSDEESQVVGALHVLQKEFGITVYTFAYPFVEISPGLRKQVENTHLLARGGYATSYEITPDQDPDWMNIPARGTLTDTPLSTYRDWIGADYRKGGWLVWVIHGLEGTQSGWEPISKKNFEGILDDLQTKDIWVGTFLEVGSYFRAEKVFEKAKMQESVSEKKWTWEVPDHFPNDVLLKVRLDSPASAASAGIELWQGNKKLTPDGAGVYSINFFLRELALRLSPKT
jgi:peptidoglycan/xylan/chitin deacetylase (PgdA/CDA1 family)